ATEPSRSFADIAHYSCRGQSAPVGTFSSRTEVAPASTTPLHCLDRLPLRASTLPALPPTVALAPAPEPERNARWDRLLECQLLFANEEWPRHADCSSTEE